MKTVKRKGSNVDHFEKRKFCFEKRPFTSQWKSEKGFRLEDPRWRFEKLTKEHKEKIWKKERRNTFCINSLQVFKQHCIISLHKSSSNKIACHNMASIALKIIWLRKMQEIPIDREFFRLVAKKARKFEQEKERYEIAASSTKGLLRL